MLGKMNTIKGSAITKKQHQQNLVKKNNLSRKLKKIRNCFVQNDLHIPAKIDSPNAKFYQQLMLRLNLDSSIQVKDYYDHYLIKRLNLEYRSTSETVTLQGTPKTLDSAQNLSLPVCPYLLTEKLRQVKQNEQKSEIQNQVAKSNNYVSLN